jgi:hypothetical protein
MPDLPDRQTDDIPLHKFWWLHDARWYQGVRKRFGADAANEVNEEAIAFVARRIARWYTHANGLDFTTMPMDELVKWFGQIVAIMWTEGMTRVTHTADGENEFTSVVTDHFALQMLRAARSLEAYRCPCLRMRAGLFEGMGLQVEDRRIACQSDGSDSCQFHAVLRRPLGGADALSPTGR